MLAALVAAANLSATPESLELRAREEVVHEFERVGRSAPVPDARLSAAARVLATEALATSARDAADVLGIADAVSAAGASDPSPRALLLRASDAASALRALPGRPDLTEEPASHAGIGVALEGDRTALVVLTAMRKAKLSPFPRSFAAPGPPRELCGELETPLARPELFVTNPKGTPARVVGRSQGGQFCAPIPLADRGRSTVEVLGHGPRGPEVAAIFFVDVGAAVAAERGKRLTEPTTAEAARAALEDRVNALRLAHGLLPLAPEPALTSVAQAYAQQMSTQNFFAHVDPEGHALVDRLKAAGCAYEAAAENLGAATGPLSAQLGIELSPGHLKALLEPNYTHLGVGVALKPGGDAIVVEVLTKPGHPIRSLADAYAVAAERRRSVGLPPLARNLTLERLAQEHAARALAEQSPQAKLPDSPLHERVFEADPAISTASVDVFIADDPGAIASSKSLVAPQFNQLGIGGVKGDSAKYGPSKWWLVVVFAAEGPRSE